MPVIALISPKGGTGKTTAALLLACGFVESGRDTVVIDADPNQPLVRWKARAGDMAGLAVLPAADTARLANTIAAAKRVAGQRNEGWVVIDTEGSSAREGAATSASAIAAADLALIPLGPSAIEAHEAVKAVAHVRLAERRIGRAIPHAVLLTRMPAAIRPRTLRTMVEELTAQGVPILPAALVEKEAYRVMFALGWPLSRLTESHVGGLPAARGNAEALVRAVLTWRERVGPSQAPKPEDAPPPPASEPTP